MLTMTPFHVSEMSQLVVALDMLLLMIVSLVEYVIEYGCVGLA